MGKRRELDDTTRPVRSNSRNNENARDETGHCHVNNGKTNFIVQIWKGEGKGKRYIAEMAESIVTIFLMKLSELLEKEANFLIGVDEQVKLLQSKLEWMRSFLKEADEKRKENARVKIWVDQIRDVAYDADDVIDTFILKVERHHQQQHGWRKYIASPKLVKLRHELRKKIEEINTTVDRISANKSKYGIEGVQQVGASSSSWHEGPSLREKRAPIVEEADVVGFKDDAITLVRRLIGGEARRSIISIVGMGGIGKTTLAKKVYNNSYVKRHFNFHGWVYVSEKYRVRELLRELIKSFKVLTREEIDTTSEEALRNKLFGYLRNRKYLLVIDDIWSTDAWEGLEAALPRNKAVALHADAESIPHELQFLRQEECWELLCKKAFPRNVGHNCPSDLEEVGKSIVSKCGGLPITIVVLGGLLSRKEKLPNEWAKVLKSVSWQLREGENQISRILALSYNDLPYYLKSCFLYFGVFLEDSEISAMVLIRLWIAEGFIQQRGEETMEEVAEDYLQELIHRSLIQAVGRNSRGGIKTCRIHDLLRDLSISEAREDKFLHVRDSINLQSSFKARRIAIHHGIQECVSESHTIPRIRSILCFTPEKEDLGLGNLGRFKLLRVMDLQGALVLSLHDEIGKLINLRYLGLRGNHLNEIPSSIGGLFNLQTLDLRGLKILILPITIEKMKQLRHLHMGYLSKFAGHPRLECMSSLQTLSKLRVSSWAKDSLGKLVNLTKLGIFGDFSQPGFLDSIRGLEHLQSLRVKEWQGGRIGSLVPLSSHIHLYNLHLDGRIARLPDLCELPPNLTKLSLRLCELRQDPFPTLEKLRSLRILRLRIDSFVGKEMVCSMGGFLLLESLELKGLGELQEWKVEEGAVTSLKRLEINSCGQLKMLPEGLRHVSSLRELELVNMPRRFLLKLRESDGDDWYKIQHIPSVITK
ncbi:putative disease resistance protein At1g50180 [Magnolia sinica]|uniref:putative disease resistance protein At1g50180 n=1 Tax=Magnolia sinica TaxID=86752 RepID=UPI00265875DF|nr:putative disease resistance protein At1g50180 [Magnolia sinica]